MGYFKDIAIDQLIAEEESFGTQLRNLNEYRKQILQSLEPRPESDYTFGGAHRCWVKACATQTAYDYIAQARAIEGKYGNDFVVVSHMAIPMPPAWNGVRPAEIDESYGHPHLTFKDWRHFENTLRYTFAKEGYIAIATGVNNNKEIVFLADKMVNVAKMPLTRLNPNDYDGKKPQNQASVLEYDEFCATTHKKYCETA